MTDDPARGIVQFLSPWPFQDTVDRIAAAFRARKIKVFDRIDQTAEAAAVGLSLRPTTLFIFGDPAKGTPLMAAHPTLAIDLPLKALIWEAEPGKVFVGLASPEYLQARHGLPSAPFTEVVQLFRGLLGADPRP